MPENLILAGLAARIERAKKKNLPPVVIMKYEMHLKHLTNGLDPGNRKEGKYIVWAPSGGAPGAIIDAFENLNYFDVTGYGYLAGVWGFASKYIDIADKAGFNRDTCSSVRTTVGVALSGEVPAPDLIMGSSMWCENFRPWSYVAARFGIPMYEMEGLRPYYGEEDAVKYMIKDCERFIKFIEDTFGQKMDMDELALRVQKRLEAAEVAREINLLRQTVPTPVKGRDAMRLYAGWDGAPGSSKEDGGTGASVGMANMVAIRDEVKAKVARGEGAVPEENYRLIWCQTPPFYTDLTGYMEEEHGATCVFNDPHKHIWWEPGEYDGMPPLEAIARQQLGEPWGGAGTRRIDTLIQNARDYKADGVIFFKSWGCRVSGLHGRQFQEKIMNELGIPVLILDEDYMDIDNYSEEETKMKLDSFVYMMD